jgi:toxin ParE1/3/4
MLEGIEDYMAEHGRSEASIERYSGGVFDFCEGLSSFPKRGTVYDDVMPGLRITNFKGDTILAFVVDEEARTVTFLGITYGGQDWQPMYRQSFHH